MPGNCNRLALHSVQQLPKTVLSLHGGHGNHRFHPIKLANMDNIVILASLQLTKTYPIGWRKIVFSFSGADRRGFLAE